MSKNWKSSGLKVGTKVQIPTSLFIEPTKARDRLISVTYTGETKQGLLLDCKFKPSLKTINPNGSHYRLFINWASIWCGDVRLCLEDDTIIRAHYAQDTFIGE